MLREWANCALGPILSENGTVKGLIKLNETLLL